jgi:EmrB/QacA subfamily drug resistance transporter
MNVGSGLHRWSESLLDAMLRAREPAPSNFLLRRSYYPWLVVGTTCVAAFIGQLDASIVQLALPTLERSFNATLDNVSWVAVGYVLAFAAVLPVFARMAEILGRKLMYLSGFALFGLSSALCGLAPGLPWLIAFRVLQGASGAMLGANSIVILVTAAGPARRGRAMGIFAAAQAVGISVGPVFGGFLLAATNWRWIFWVNVPFACAVVIVGWLVVPRTTNLGTERGFDWRGALLLSPALITFMMAVMESHAWGLRSTRTIACVIAAVVLLAAFIREEQRIRAPLIDLHLFRSPAFSGGCIAVMVSYAMLYSMFFAMSFALVRGCHDQPLAAGLRLTIIPLALGIVAPFSGSLYETRPRLVMVGGMTICAVAALALNKLLTGAEHSLTGVMIALAVFGGGLGVFIAPNNSATVSAAPADKSGEAGGLLNLMRSCGTGIGVAAASSVLAWRLEAATGISGHTMGAAESALLAAVGDVLLMLVVFAIIAGTASLLRPGSGRRAGTFVASDRSRQKAAT